MSQFRTTEIDSGKPDTWVPRINDDGAQIGNDIVAEDVNELSDAIFDTQTALLKTNVYDPATLLGAGEGIVSRLKTIEITAGLMTLQDAYDNALGNRIAIASNRDLTLGNSNLVINSQGHLTIASSRFFVKGTGAANLKIAGDAITTSLSDLTIGTVSADTSLTLLSADQIILKDRWLQNPVTLSESGAVKLDTLSNSLVGAINELKSGTFTTTFDSVYAQTEGAPLTTSSTYGSFRVVNGTGNRERHALSVEGKILVSDDLEAGGIRVLSNDVAVLSIGTAQMLSSIPIISSNYISTPFLKSDNELKLEDSRTHFYLSENGQYALPGGSESLVGALNYLEGILLDIGGVATSFNLQHSTDGRHQKVTMKSTLGENEQNQIKIENSSSETTFSVTGDGKVFAKEISIGAADIGDALAQLSNHLTDGDGKHAELTDHKATDNPHGSVQTINGMSSNVVLTPGVGVSITPGGNGQSLTISAETVETTLQDCYSAGTHGEILMALDRDVTWKDESESEIVRITQDSLVCLKDLIFGSSYGLISATSNLTMSAESTLELVSQTENVEIKALGASKKVVIQGIDFTDEASTALLPSMNQTVVGSINELRSHDTRVFVNEMGHVIVKGEPIIIAPLSTLITTPVMMSPFFNFHPSNLDVNAFGSSFSTNIWIATEEIAPGVEGVFVRKGNLSMRHPNDLGSNYEWQGSELFLAPTAYGFISVDNLDLLAEGDQITLSIGGVSKVFTMTYGAADYDNGIFAHHEREQDLLENLIRAINNITYTRDPASYMGVYAVRDGCATSGKIVLSANLDAGDAITFEAPPGASEDVTLTAVANETLDGYIPTKVNEFLIGSTTEETTENLARAINRTQQSFNLDANIRIDHFASHHFINRKNSDRHSANGHLMEATPSGTTIRFSGTELSSELDEWSLTVNGGNITTFNPSGSYFQIKYIVEDRENREALCSNTGSGFASTNAFIPQFSDRFYVNANEKEMILAEDVLYQNPPKIAEVVETTTTTIDCYIDME